MDLKDRYGNRLQTRSTRARDHYIAGVDHILAATDGAVTAFEDAVAEDPGFALAHVGLARARMYAADMAGAKAAMADAEAHAEPDDAREASHIAAFQALLAGDAAKARSCVRAHVRDHPRDALCAQLCTNVFGLIGFSGETGREADLFAFTESLLPHYGADWWMQSMHALSLCEIGRPHESIALMEQSLAQNPRNANAAHFKAHAQYEIGETRAGLAYLTDWMRDYSSNAVLHGHLSWHMGLWSLQTGDLETMWRAVDEAIGPGGAKGLPINVLTDTAALLYRAELAGAEVTPERWQQISDYAARFFPTPGQSFADIHAALAHAMAGDAERLARLTEAPAGFAGDLVAPVAQGWAAIARGDWSGALSALTPVMGDHARLGGSRAQRDLLELTWLNLLLKLGHSDEARRMMATRRPLFADAAPVAGFA